MVAVGLEIDHIVPLELGGAEEDWNCEGLCPDHHAQKTKADARAIAKARRIRKKEAGEGRPKKPIANRGWGNLTRGFDGKPKLKKKRLREA